MRDVDTQMEAILNRIKEHGYVLMLDFDGVLAPIVARPHRARMSRRTRHLLAACARRCRVAGISGRTLADVRTRVGLTDIWYAGNHGVEWSMGKKRGHEKFSSTVRKSMRAALNAFEELSERYPNVVVEDKKLTFSVHFRGLARSRVAQFRKETERIAKKFGRQLDVAEGDEFLFNVRPLKSRTKGDAVRLARTCAPAKAVPIYIGDDTTDEDAFRALPRGITIRVGARRGSAARFFVRTRRDVDTILETFAHF